MFSFVVWSQNSTTHIQLEIFGSLSVRILWSRIYYNIIRSTKWLRVSVPENFGKN